MSRAHVIVAAIMVVASAASAADAGEHAVPPNATFDVTIEHAVPGGVPGGKQVKLLQTGGPLGGFLPGSSLDMAIDFDAMIAAGAMFGSGGIVVGDETVKYFITEFS